MPEPARDWPKPPSRSRFLETAAAILLLLAGVAFGWMAHEVARPVPGHPGRLEVRFAPDWLSWLPMVWADYWVVDLDPGYEWAVVGSPNRKYLWILSRTPTMEKALFERIKARAEKMGYDLKPLVMAAPLT